MSDQHAPTVEIPAGWEWTGEVRPASAGEHYAGTGITGGWGACLCVKSTGRHAVHILRRIRP